MNTILKSRFATSVLIVCGILIPALPSASASNAVWHCSRMAESVVGEAGEVDKNDFFQLASMGLNSDSIGITMTDLLDVYSNKPIRVNGKVLTACFMPGNTSLSNLALNSLGLKSAAMQQQSRQSAIIQSNLQLVTDEAEMAACIAKRYPAVGYLSQVIEDERVVPCF